MGTRTDLLYEADVPVEPSSAGALFMHRLIGSCEPRRWQIVETNVNPKRCNIRLDGPTWRHRRRRGLRLLSTPGAGLWAAFLAFRSWYLPPPFIGPKPRAIYTVAHGFSWLGVVALAKRHGVRCVVHCHDHPQSGFPTGVGGWRVVSPIVRRALLTADACLAVCPTGEEWLREIGVRRTGIVYSVWNDDSPPTHKEIRGNRVLGYAGSIADPGYRRGIIAASFAAAHAKWRMVVFPSTSVDASLRNAVAPVVEWRETVRSTDLPNHLATAADVALITTDFDPARRDWVRVACPAKLADYAYAGIPIIAIVPPWSSLARVASDNPDLLTVVPTQEIDALQAVLSRFDHRDSQKSEAARRSAQAIVGLAPNVDRLRVALGLDYEQITSLTRST